jgi:hypothetical protein
MEQNHTFVFSPRLAFCFRDWMTLLFLMGGACLQAQLLPMTVTEVTFHAPSDTRDWVPVRPDPADIPPGSGVVPPEVPIPSNKEVKIWNSNSPLTSKAVGYVSGSKMSISAKFICTTQSCQVGVVGIRAEIIGGGEVFNLPITVIKLEQEGVYKLFIAEIEEEFLPLVVKYYDFQIKWYFLSDLESLSNEEEYIGTTLAKVYVTHKRPIQGFGTMSLSNPATQEEATTFYQTCLDISCKEADGKSSTDIIVQSIFNKFQSHCVAKYPGNICMKYWGNDNPLSSGCRGIRGLLAFNDANCGEWAELFIDMIKLQGIDRCKIGLVGYGDDEESSPQGYPTAISTMNGSSIGMLNAEVIDFFGIDDAANVTPANLNGYFFVNYWNFNISNRFYYYFTGPGSDFPYEGASPEEFIVNTIGKEIRGADVTGVVAQGNDNPKSFFYDHATVEYFKDNGSTVIYDPSYGTPYANSPFPNINAWEAESLKGYGMVLRYVKGFEIHFLFWVKEFNIPNIQQIKFR